MTLRRRKNAGFTLVELMVATLIFSMVIAGLAVIYSTVYRQGIRSLHEANIKVMGFVAMKAIANDLSEASMLKAPIFGDDGDTLSGLKNCGETYEAGACYPITTDDNTPEWFKFCLSDSGVGDCLAETGFKCLWWYWDDGSTVSPVPCGDPGPNRQLLAKDVDYDEMAKVFSRSAADGVDERNQVRVNFRMERNAVNTPGAPKVSYSLDSTFNVQFSEPP